MLLGRIRVAWVLQALLRSEGNVERSRAARQDTWRSVRYEVFLVRVGAVGPKREERVELKEALTKSLASAQSRDLTFLPLTPKP